jgi:hypothetical protein
MSLFEKIRILSCCNFFTTVLDRRSLILLDLIFPTQIIQKEISFWMKGSFFEKLIKGGF